MAKEVGRGGAFKEKGLLRTYFAELVGTFILILFGDGAVVAAVITGHPSYEWIMVLWGVGVMLAVYLVGGISGAHLNPFVTIALAVGKRHKWRDVIPYIIVQVLGAYLAAAAIWGFYGTLISQIDPPGTTLYANVALAFFANYPNPAFYPQYWPANLLIPGTAGAGTMVAMVDTVFPMWMGAFAEGFFTFVLLLVVVGVTDARNTAVGKYMGGPLIGLGYVTCFLIMEAQITQGMINWARSIGPMLFLLTLGYTGGVFNYRGQYFWVFGIPGLIGAILAVLFWDNVLAPHWKTKM